MQLTTSLSVYVSSSLGSSSKCSNFFAQLIIRRLYLLFQLLYSWFTSLDLSNCDIPLRDTGLEASGWLSGSGL